MITAIENIPNAFAFYDTNDCLMVCNQRYQSLIETDSFQITKGMSFETILHQAAIHHLVEKSEAEKELWIQNCLHYHHHPENDLIQPWSDKQWMQISERKIVGIGTVMM
jgi:hypothetical protein